VGGDPAARPVFVLVTVAATLAGFVAASAAGVSPAWAAFAGAAVLAARALAQRRTTVAAVGRSAAVPFLLFVLGLGIVVQAVVGNGLDRILGPLIPGGTSLPALLATAALSAVLANLINNLPAVLVLLPLAACGRRIHPAPAPSRPRRPARQVPTLPTGRARRGSRGRGARAA